MEPGPIGILLVDRTRFRLVVVDAGEITEPAVGADDLLRDYDTGPRGDVTSHLEEHVAQHVRAAARAVVAVGDAVPFAALVVGGNAELVAAVLDRLPARHRSLVEVVAGLGPAADEPTLRDVADRAADRAAVRREAAAVATLRERSWARSPRPAVTGLDAVADAAAEDRVDVLLVSSGFRRPGWYCRTCGHHRTVGPRCPVCDARMVAVEDVVGAVVAQVEGFGGTVQWCERSADLDVVGRIGALLRH